MNVASIALLKASVHLITRIAGNIWPKLFDNCLRYLDFFNNCSGNIKAFAYESLEVGEQLLFQLM